MRAGSSESCIRERVRYSARTRTNHPVPMKTIALLIAALSALVLASCNTMSGLGRDMQKAGTSLENEAERPR